MRSLWMDPEESHYEQLSGDLEVDILIIGGGLTGIGAAYAMRDSGARVALLEERSLSSGASGRNAGFVLAGPALMYDEAAVTLGAEAARAIWDFTLDNNNTIDGLVEEHEIDCGYLRRGSMSLAASEEEWKHLQRANGCLQTAGISACLVDAGYLPKPFDRIYHGGLYYPGNAEINPACFVRGVAASLASSVSIFENSTVLTLTYDGVWSAFTPLGVVRARSALLATNAYTPRILKRMPIKPTRGQVIATQILDRVLVPFPMYAGEGYQYWRQTTDGRLVVGGWRNTDLEAEWSATEELNHGIQERLHDFCRLLAGHGVTIEFRWAGIMGFTPDMLPVVGRVPGADELFIAAGFSGHGVSMAYSCGGSVAAMALGTKSNVPHAFSPERLLQVGALTAN